MEKIIFWGVHPEKLVAYVSNQFLIVDDVVYTFHHTSTMGGYVSRKTRGSILPYSGKFGVGYKVLTPRWDTTNYCYVSYYIRKKKKLD